MGNTALNLPRFLYHPHDVAEFETGGRKFVTGYADGINAYGLIGTEYAGVFVVDDTGEIWVEPIKEPISFVRDITFMSQAELEHLFETRGRGNPFKLERSEKKAKTLDKKIRNTLEFEDSPRLSAVQKRSLARGLELFILARKTSPELGRQKFSKALYQELHMHWGHIAHYNISGFYDAQLLEDADFYRNLRYWARGESLYGYAPQTPIDVRQAFSKIAQAYL